MGYPPVYHNGDTHPGTTTGIPTHVPQRGYPPGYIHHTDGPYPGMYTTLMGHTRAIHHLGIPTRAIHHLGIPPGYVSPYHAGYTTWVYTPPCHAGIHYPVYIHPCTSPGIPPSVRTSGYTVSTVSGAGQRSPGL